MWGPGEQLIVISNTNNSTIIQQNSKLLAGIPIRNKISQLMKKARSQNIVGLSLLSSL
jgi:hypothetical protein